MKNTWILFRKEMMGYFFSPIAYIVGVCFLLVMGSGFYMISDLLTRQPSEFSASYWFFNWPISWFAILIMIPIVTMRLFADEKRTGTIETLMTAPVRDWEYVLAKFAGGFIFYLMLWAPTLLYLFVLRHFSSDTTPIDWGSMLGSYLGIFLIGMLLVSMGCMASACTRNQIIAAILGFAMGCSLFYGGFYFYINAAEATRDFFEYFSMLDHMQKLSRGVLEWERAVFYLTSSFFFLFVTHRIVQARQWKN